MLSGLQEAASRSNSDHDVEATSPSGAASLQAQPTAAFDNSSQSSTTSHLSAPGDLGLSTSDGPNQPVPAPTAEELTPPSSTTSSTPDDEATPQFPVPNKPTTSHDASGRTSNKSSASPVPSAGNKRTASGHVKPLDRESSALSSHSDLSECGHARASSTFSIESKNNVTEISQHLRTKLKYAMLKVQNGWQSRSLDELESIASASPRSPASGLPRYHDPRSFASPRNAVHQGPHRKWSESSSPESGHSEPRHSLSSRPGPSDIADVGVSGGSSRGLAPPVDIIAGTRRRPSPNDSYVHHGSNPSQGLRPAVRPSSNQRTPSQTAASEADAVETLLFMASPNHSGYTSSLQASQESSLRSTQQWSAQTSPLRTQFSQTSVASPKKVAFSDHSKKDEPVNGSALIDRMLDNLPDESESDGAPSRTDKRSAAKLPA